MKEICDSFDAGTISHDNQDDIFRQLSVEGSKRIDAFIFEQLFREHLEAVGESTEFLFFSFGWHIGYDRFGAPAFWFRIEDEATPWNRCDEELATRLEAFRYDRYGKSPARCFKVRRTGALLLASERQNGKWTSATQLSAVLSGLSGITNGEVRNMDSVNRDAAALAFQWLKKPKLAKTLTALSIQRRFMNCMLRRYLGRDGTDLDAIVLTSEGRLTYIEFKRKFPATGRSKVFGIDRYPHLNTMQTMATMNIHMQHIILVGPRWEKEQSPLSWISPSLNEYWAWLIINLDDNAFYDGTLHTTGADSGQRHGYRSQVQIRWDQMCLLHRGLALGDSGRQKLAEALLTGSMGELSPISYAELKAITADAANKRRV